MEILKLPKSLKCYLPLLFFFVILLLMMPKVHKFNYDFKKGSPWMYEDLTSQFDFPIFKTESQYKSEKEEHRKNVSMCYEHDAEAYSQAVRTLKNCSLGDNEAVRPIIEQALSDIYDKGIVQQTDEFSSNSGVLCVEVGKNIIKKPCSDVYTPYQAQKELYSSITDIYPGINVDSLMAASSLLDILTPSLVFDSKLTYKLLAEADSEVSETSGIVTSGTLLVSKGEVITSEKEQLLNSYKAEFESKYGFQGNALFPWLSDAVLSIVLLVMLFFCVAYFAKGIFSDIDKNFNQYLYILVIFTIACSVTCLIERLNSELLFLIPFCLTVLYLQSFFKRKIVFPVYLLSLLPLLIFAHNGVQLFVMHLFAGCICLFTFGYFNRGWLQFVNALCLFFSMFIVYLAFELMQGTLDSNSFYHLSSILLGSILLVAGYPFIYLFEKLFRLVSINRLNELADTNNKLLRELANNAPGTFQHSLQLMNLVDSIGNKVGLNVELLRVGALYHDIGKMVNPSCFVENETGGTTNYHASKTPKESAKAIIEHVDYGLALADEHNLPDIVKDFIITHHGTSLTAYFYTQYVNAGGDEADKVDFQYHGQLPTTKEQALLMICDSVEAGARTLKDYDEHTIGGFIDKIISSKIGAGQLDDASISVKELKLIREELKNCVMNMYHDRVEYPKLKRPKSKERK